MKRLYLEPEEKALPEGEHAAQTDGKERDRLKAILLLSEGWTVPQISQALRLQSNYCPFTTDKNCHAPLLQ